MSARQSLVDAARRIDAEPAPVLLLDTCALLDLLRVPFRRSQLRGGLVEAAQRAIEGARARPRRVWLVVTSLVIHELDEHIGGVEAELDAFLGAMDEDISRVLAVLDLLPSARPSGMSSPAFRSTELVPALRALAQGLATSAVVLAEDDACVARARHRSMAGRAPAGKGKESRKDCEILEHYLELCRLLDPSEPRRVLISSNVQDYRLVGANRDPSLDEDFARVSLSFARELASALGMAGLASPARS